MSGQIRVDPLGWFARLVEFVMILIMKARYGAWREAPPRTRQGNIPLSRIRLGGFSEGMMVHSEGIHDSVPSNWRHYIVVEPIKSIGSSGTDVEWHVGWKTGDACGVSRILLSGPVRVPVCRGNHSFFGVKSRTGDQLFVRRVGAGYIGDDGDFHEVPFVMI